jgi:hypothetical protein
MANKEWEEETTTISRGELADIMSEELHRVLAAAHVVGGHGFAREVENLLVEFAARIGATVFKGFVENDEEV